MPFTMPNYPSLTQEQASPYANLISNALDTYKNAVSARYAPLTAESNAYSKIAYARLMGPQFMAKLMGNKDLLASMPHPQQTLNTITNAGTQLSGGNTGSGSGMDNDDFLRLFPIISKMLEERQNTQQQGNPAPQGMPQPNVQMPPQGAPQSAPQPARAPQLSPQAQQDFANEPPQGTPEHDAWMRNPAQSNTGAPVSAPASADTPQALAERSGTFQGIESEGKTAGELRAKKIAELGEDVASGQDFETKANEITKLFNSPVFEHMRQNPLAGHYELSYYKLKGTPEEKEAVGKYYANQGELVQDFVSRFKGQSTNKEIGAANLAKPSDSDDANVARGKMEAIRTLRAIGTQKSSLIADIMEQKHISERKAADIANKQLNTDEIVDSIKKKIYPEREKNEKDQAYARKVAEDFVKENANSSEQDIMTSLKSQDENGRAQSIEAFKRAGRLVKVDGEWHWQLPKPKK